MVLGCTARQKVKQVGRKQTRVCVKSVDKSWDRNHGPHQEPCKDVMDEFAAAPWKDSRNLRMLRQESTM
jgi:hypothetical protein